MELYFSARWNKKGPENRRENSLFPLYLYSGYRYVRHFLHLQCYEPEAPYHYKKQAPQPGSDTSRNRFSKELPAGAGLHHSAQKKHNGPLIPRYQAVLKE